MYYIGIDGGGTQTTALLTDSEGHELGRTSGPPGIIDVLDPEAGAHALADLASQTLTDAGIDAQASVIVCALAGAGREPERTRLEQSLEAQRVAGTVCITTDFDAAMHDAFGGGSGILVIAGTGSSAWGRNEDGRTARAGGWGVILGDEGSGYAIGTAALRRCMREFDGRDHGDDWVPLILAQTGVSSVEQLVRWAAAAPKADIAALAPAVFEAAFRGNAVGRGIVLNAAKEIAKHVVALHERLKPWKTEPAVALTGGLIAPGRPLRDEVLHALEQTGLHLPILNRTIDAARGAAAIARAT